MPSEAERQALFDELALQSRAVHTRLSDGRRLGVEQQEETITESLLLDLARKQPRVVVKTFTRAEESRRTGADWEWWWEGERQWFGALVQAKKPKRDGAAYGYDFGYRPRPSEARPDPERQIELLLGSARSRGLPPLYALYSGPELTVDRTSWTCSELVAEEKVMGVAALPAAVAAWLLGLGATDQQTVTGLARPLPCLLCPAGCLGYRTPLWWLMQAIEVGPTDLGFDPETPDDDPPFRVALSYLAALAQARSAQFRAIPTRVTPPEVALVQRGVRDEPPSYVYQALDVGIDDEDFDDDDLPPRLVIVRRSAETQGPPDA